MEIPADVAMLAYSRFVLLGEIAILACMKPSAPEGMPLVSGRHVVPPSVDLNIPPPGPLHALFSHGPCRASHSAAYTVSGCAGSICTSLAPVFSSLPSTFVKLRPPSVER